MKNIFCFLFLMLCLFQSGYGQSRTYYVDSQSGNDNNTGLAETAAWRSLTKVNSMTFQPGDRILFRAGSVWDNAILWPQGSGAPGAPIIIDAYGDISDDNNKPRINVNFRKTANVGLPELRAIAPDIQVSAGLILHNVSYWEVNNLQITNDGGNFIEPGWWRRSVYGVFLSTRNYGVMEHIYIRNMYIHNVQGYSGSDHACGRGIIALSSGSTSFEIDPDDTPSYFNDLRIENNRLENIVRIGITVFASSFYNYRWSNTPAPQPGDLYAVPVKSTNVIIRGNLIENVAKDGIILASTNGGLVEHNIVRGGGMEGPGPSAGIWVYTSENAVFQYNEVSGFMCTTDGQAFDIDYYTTNSLFQYNYSHNNAGGFMLLCSPFWAFSTGNVIRYNISQNDGAARGWNNNGQKGFPIKLTGGHTNTYIYNNTFYIADVPVDNRPSGSGTGNNRPTGTNVGRTYSMIRSEDWGESGGSGGQTRNIRFENNIFIFESTNMESFLSAASGSFTNQLTFDNNVYIGISGGLPASSRNTNATILSGPASNYFYGAGTALFGLESAIAAYTPRQIEALGTLTGTTIAEQPFISTEYHLGNGTAFTPGVNAWPYTLYRFGNYNPKFDFAGNAINDGQPRQVGAILPSSTPPNGGMLPAPANVATTTSATGIGVTFDEVSGAAAYKLVYGRTHGFGFQARTVTGPYAQINGIVLNITGSNHAYFDEYFFKVCAIDANGNEGYYSPDRRRRVNRTGAADTNPFYRHELPEVDVDAVTEEVMLEVGFVVANPDITDVPTTATAGRPLALSGKVTPYHQTINWDVADAGATGATISNGSILNTTNQGTVVLTASVGSFSKNFSITVEYVAVDDVSGIPTNGSVGRPLTLTGTVSPSNAPNQIVWSVTGTGASIIGNTLHTTNVGTVVVTATIERGTSPTEAYTQEFPIEISLIPVTNIRSVPFNATAGIPLFLSGVVNPADATYRTIEWSVRDAGTTGAQISGSMLYTTAGGNVTVTATIISGRAPGENYTRDFDIEVSTVAVTNIRSVPGDAIVGEPLTLTGTVIPEDATFQNIVWSIKDAGTTGATITDGATLNTTASGAVIVTATIINGVSTGVNYVRDFTVMVTGEGNVTHLPELVTEPELRAWIHNGLLRVAGLTIGEPWSVYSVSGAIVYNGVATSNIVDVSLNAPGVYFVKSGENTIKVTFH